MVSCIFQASKLVNIYQPRKSSRAFVSRQKASNKFYTVLYTLFFTRIFGQIQNLYYAFQSKTNLGNTEWLSKSIF
jgi:hypothetical protein